MNSAPGRLVRSVQLYSISIKYLTFLFAIYDIKAIDIKTNAFVNSLLNEFHLISHDYHFFTCTCPILFSWKCLNETILFFIVLSFVLFSNSVNFEVEIIEGSGQESEEDILVEMPTVEPSFDKNLSARHWVSSKKSYKFS